MAGPLVTDPQNGIAISGFDPVAYFADGRAEVGRSELELNSAGGVWRFRNEGNRAAFAANPEVYAPQFGGYDPLAIADGRAVPGHPQIFTIAGERLYLFYSAEARATFAGDPQYFIAAAARNWPTVQRALP